MYFHFAVKVVLCLFYTSDSWVQPEEKNTVTLSGCAENEMLSCEQTKPGWSTALIAEWLHPRLEESQSQQITENVSVIHFVALLNAGYWRAEKGPCVRRDSLLTLIRHWITPPPTHPSSPPVKSSDRHDASHHTPSSAFIFYFFFCTLMRFDTAQNKNSHCVCPPRVSGLRLLILVSASAVGQQSTIHMYSREMSVWPERAGCARGFELNLSCHVTVKLDGCSTTQ